MSDTSIKVLPNGPFMVEGAFSLQSADGQDLTAGKTKVALCRCGASANKPFCDGAHSKIGFAG